MLEAAKSRISARYKNLDELFADVFDQYDNSEHDDDNPIFPQPWDDRRRR